MRVFAQPTEMPWRRERLECPDCGGIGGIPHEEFEDGVSCAVWEDCQRCEGREWIYADEQTEEAMDAS